MNATSTRPQPAIFTPDRTPLLVFVLAVLYAIGLARLERKLPIKPKYTWAEVVLGSILMLLPTFITRRVCNLSADAFESLIIYCCLSAAIPIVTREIVEDLLGSRNPAPIRPIAAPAMPSAPATVQMRRTA